MGEPKSIETYTFEEYLKIDEASESRYEYVHGQIFSMAGSSKNHNRISRNLLVDIHTKLKGKKKKCDTFMSDVRLEIENFKLYYYPDVLVSCNENDWEDEKAVTSPILVAEVLSTSTAAKDTSEKLIAYLQIPTLQYYLVISQEKVEIAFYERTEHGWVVRFFTEIRAVIALAKLDIDILLADIYSGVIWEDIA